VRRLRASTRACLRTALARSSGRRSGASSPTTTTASLQSPSAAASRAASRRATRETQAFGSPSTSSWGTNATATAGRRSRCLRNHPGLGAGRLGGGDAAEEAPGGGSGEPGTIAGREEASPAARWGATDGFAAASAAAADTASTARVRFLAPITDDAAAMSSTPAHSSGARGPERRCCATAGCRSARPRSATNPSGGVGDAGTANAGAGAPGGPPGDAIATTARARIARIASSRDARLEMGTRAHARRADESTSCLEQHGGDR
jgi:hypothetical protein